LHFGAEATDMLKVAFTPGGRWLATLALGNQPYRLALWPLSDRYPRVLRSSQGDIKGLVRFHPDGSRLFTTVYGEDGSGALLSWSLAGDAGLEPTLLFRDADFMDAAVDPQGRFLVVNSYSGTWKIPLDGTAPTTFEGLDRYSYHLSFDPTGRYLASRPGRSPSPTVAVLDLETGERIELEEPGDGRAMAPSFDGAGRLVVTRGGVVSRWDPRTRETEVLVSEGVFWAAPLPDGRSLVVVWEGTGGTRTMLDLETGSRTVVPQVHQPPSYVYGDDLTGSIVASGHPDGEVRVGSPTSEEPHLLLGHEPGATRVSISPDNKWVVSLGVEGAVYLWPMPDLSKRPLHTLPYDELMARLKALTNLRAVADEESHTGYTIKPDFTAYRGWEEVPTW
jgi:WD40 repeat protein